MPKRTREENLSTIVDDLCGQFNGDATWIRRDAARAALPSRDVVLGLVEDLRSVLFPGYFGTSELSAETLKYHVGSRLDRVLGILREQIRRGLCFVCPEETLSGCADCDTRALGITYEFIKQLPEVKAKLSKDVGAAFHGDPAATSADEAVFCYPGLAAITNYRLAHELYKLNVPLIPRIITEQAHSATGVDIHPGARIGEEFFIDHGTGVVIGETCVIGNRVRIYQGVTLGAKSLSMDDAGNPVKGIERHPMVEDDVVIYSGATILGRVCIGAGSVIGGNVWLTRSVPKGSRITQAQLRQDRFEGGGGI